MSVSSQTLDSTFAALADPTRRGIIRRLAGQELRVKELATAFPISLPALSKHLRVLEQAGLLVRKREGRFQRCQLIAKPMRDANAWMAQYRHFWHEQFSALEQQLSPLGDFSWTDKTTAATHHGRIKEQGTRRHQSKARDIRQAASSLNTTFAALSNETRRLILAHLAEHEAAVSDLAAPFHMSLPAVSKHLRILRQANLLTQTKEGRVRRCQFIAEPMAEAAAWIAKYQRFWEDRFAALEQYLSAENQKEQNT